MNISIKTRRNSESIQTVKLYENETKNVSSLYLDVYIVNHTQFNSNSFNILSSLDFLIIQKCPSTFYLYNKLTRSISSNFQNEMKSLE